MPSPLNQDIDAHEPGPANTRGMMPEPSQLLHSLSAAPHPSPSQAVYVDRHMLILMNYFLADVMMYKMFGQSNIQIYQRLSCCSC